MPSEHALSRLKRPEPKFPRVREKILDNVADPSKLVFLSSFDHANVAYPSRILSANLRAGELVRNLKSEGVVGVSIMMDTIEPSSDERLEGGGYALAVGLLPKNLTQVLEQEDVMYSRNTVRRLNTDQILEAVQRSMSSELAKVDVPKNQRDEYQLHIYTRLQTILSLYNLAITEGISKGQDAPKIIANIRRTIDKYVGADTSWLRRVMQTHLAANIANALEEMASAGFPIWEMPLKANENFFRDVTPEGRVRGKGYFQDGKFVVVDSKQSIYREIAKEKVFDEMRAGMLIPSAPVMVGTVMVASEIPHYGNTYGLEQVTSDWLGIDGAGLRLTGDNEDGSPIGSVAVQKRAFSHIPLDLMHYSREGFKRKLALAVSENRPQFERKFGDIDI